MTIDQFKEYVKSGKALDTNEIHRFMDEMSRQARRMTFKLNRDYHEPDEIRTILSELFGYQVPSTLRVFPPFYSDFGKNITVGNDVFINACCHFQDHGGVTIGDGSQIGHNVVFATNATILQGVTIGDNAIIAAGAVVNKDVAANTVVGGVPAKSIKRI